ARRHPAVAGRRGRLRVRALVRRGHRGAPRRLGAGGGPAAMSLVTRCPNCATAFRVLPEQLAARNGQVRCGKCNTVFDGVAALVGTGPTSPPSEVPEKSEVPEQSEPAPEPLPAFLAEPPPPRRGLWRALVALAAAALLAQA